MPTTRTTRVGAIAVALTMGTLSGCTSAPEPDNGPPTVLESPAMEWVDGIEPAQNDLENNRYIQGAREYYLADALAWNTGDFTISQLTDFLSDAQLDSVVSAYSRQGNHPYVYTAPMPFTVMSVEYKEAHPEYEDSVARVSYTVCAAPEKEYLISARSGGVAQDENIARELSFDRDTTDPRLFSVARILDVDCSDVTNIPVHRFVDQPVLPEVPVDRPVRDRIDSVKTWPAK